MTGRFLDKAYAARDADATRALYDDWAASYEAETQENGYITPTRCAEALRSVGAGLDQPILDFGCGTGLSGMALRQAGFQTLDGLDLSVEMLAEARKKGVYRNLAQIDADAALPINKGAYPVIAAIGVIGAGAAPISVLHTLMENLAPTGKLLFSFNDHALEDPVNKAGVAKWTEPGAAHLIFCEHGPHLPGIGLNSTVYILEKQ